MCEHELMNFILATAKNTKENKKNMASETLQSPLFVIVFFMTINQELKLQN